MCVSRCLIRSGPGNLRISIEIFGIHLVFAAHSRPLHAPADDEMSKPLWINGKREYCVTEMRESYENIMPEQKDVLRCSDRVERNEWQTERYAIHKYCHLLYAVTQQPTGYDARVRAVHSLAWQCLECCVVPHCSGLAIAFSWII